MINSISEMEPMIPEKGLSDLEDLVIDLTTKASRLASQLKPQTIKGVGDLVRSMNCYYSNLIEGHKSHPRDIERALKGDYSNNKEKRDLQKEATAHITVQKKIDEGEAENIVSKDYISWIHKEFYDLLPEELRFVESPDTKKKVEVIPGKFRDGTVQVGRHIPPSHEALGLLLNRFEDAYNPKNLSKLKRVIAVAASHHRLLWIHPFYDGNGRVARLLSHSYLKYIGLGSSLWSISRGLSWRADEYKQVLMSADKSRQSDLDGRGNLSEEGLVHFCRFFIECCIDQVEYMSRILDPDNLLKRMKIHIEEKVESKELPKNSLSLLSYALYHGEFEKGKVAEITGLQDRQARTTLYGLIDKGILISDDIKGPVRLGFPIEVVEHWFPLLYPPEIKDKENK